MPKKLLFHFDTDPMPSVFDTVVAYDGGADHVHGYGSVTIENVAPLVAGTIFTRGDKKNSAIFVSGSNMQSGEELFEAVKRQFFGEFRVSIMIDSNGSNTTAAAMVALLAKEIPLKGKRAVILAGTGPVGQRAGVMMAQEGTEVILTSRKVDRAQAAVYAMSKAFGVNMTAAAAADKASTADILESAHIVLATGAAGVELLSEEMWKNHTTIEALSDANATPPLGIQGVKAKDKGEKRHNKLCWGALGVGNLKLNLHRRCIGKLFEANNQIFDAPQIYALAKEMV
jgi:hypothetical protein